jgi:hypothetical protein
MKHKRASGILGHNSFEKALTLLFITLKLTGHIDWHWLLVVSPMLVLYTLAVLAGLAEYALKRIEEKELSFKNKWK